MKDHRFYAESRLPIRKLEGRINVVALCIDEKPWTHYLSKDAMQGAVCGVYDRPDSPPAYSNVGLDYLRTHCKRISKSLALKLHPALFDYLDWNPDAP